MRKAEEVRQSVMEKLKKYGKGIVLVHDFQRATAEAAMDLLNDLKAGGYKIVFMKPKYSVTTNMKADLREIYGAPTPTAAEAATDVFADKYGDKYNKAVA